MMEMQDVDMMRKYYSDEAWEAWKHHYKDWPPDEWRALYKDIIAAIGSDPKGPVAQALCDRWLSIVQGASPQPAVRTGMIKVWATKSSSGRAGGALTPTRVAGWNETIHRVAV